MRAQKKGICIFFQILITLTSLIVGSSHASQYQVNIDTTGLSGATAQLAFDFIDGGSPANTLIISSFDTDGVLGNTLITGSVSGQLTSNVFLADTEFFNEYLAEITLGKTISFQFTTSDNHTDEESSPDGFSLQLLDPLTGLSLVNTTDPSGADALFRLDITGTINESISVFDAVNGEYSLSAQSAIVPLPGAMWFLVSGLGIIHVINRRGARKVS